MDPKIEDLRRRFLPPTPNPKASPSEILHSSPQYQTPAAREGPQKDTTSQNSEQEKLVSTMGPEQPSLEEISSRDKPQEFSGAKSLKPLEQAIEELFNVKLPVAQLSQQTGPPHVIPGKIMCLVRIVTL